MNPPPFPGRRADGAAARRRSAGPANAPPPLSGLMVSSKTTAAAATTATVTATAMALSSSATATTPTAPTAPLAPTAPTAPALPTAPSHAPLVSVVDDGDNGDDGDVAGGAGDPYAAPAASPLTRTDFPEISYPFAAKPLLQDASLYSNGRFSVESEGTSLNELAHLVRLAKYQERKRTQTRLRLQLTLICTALFARLVRCGDMAHRSLTEFFRSDDKASFASLYDAVHNVRQSCDALRKYALFEPELEALRSPPSVDSLDTTTAGGPLHAIVPASGSAAAAPFLGDISAEARDIFIAFLTSLRTNPDYLATRLCSLSASELGALISFHQGMEPIDSVLPFHSSRQSASRSSAAGRTPSHTGAPGGGAAGKDANRLQRFMSFQRHDPLSALIHTCFANSAGPDSAEDRRRTDVWATACARLISERGAAGEPVLVSVLNAWSAMRDWSGRSNMEWFLMKILEDGAFLLDRAEDQNGTRFNLNEWTSKDQIAAEEFYDRAINDLFEVIDDEDATGIPEGLLELGNQILKKLEPKFVDNTRSWLVYKWLFGSWLLSVVIHPETHGLMAEYHITEYGRQKILKEVALRAQRLVVEMTMSLGHSTNIKPVSIPPAIRVHIDSILNKFRDSKAHRPRARLLPARSITSLRETVEVHPYLVVSPADLVTMVNALFPDRRPRSAQSGSFRSGPGSVSNFSVISQPVPVTGQRNTAAAADAYSVLSTSMSSANSDATTSVEPLLESQQTGTSSYRSSPPPPSVTGGASNNYEDDGYRLRLAIQDMAHFLGQDVVLGACHPCEERWSVLFVSPDGSRLSTQMTYDPDDDDDDEDRDQDATTSSSSDSDDASEDDTKRADMDTVALDTNYHQLRNAILKLVEDYEIPQGLDAGDGMAHTFSNRATRLKKYRLKNNNVVMAESATAVSTQKPAAPVLQSRNPYLRHMERKEGRASTGANSNVGTGRAAADVDATTESESVLISMLSAASSQSRAQSDFLSAHQYWQTVQHLNTLSSESLRKNGFAALLNIFSRGPRDSIRRSAGAVEEYEAWLVWLRQSQERTEGVIDTMARRLRALRDKMWYVTDVRNSGPYEITRNIAVALKTMGTSRKWDAYQRSRQSKPRGPAAAYLYRTENEIVELLAATESQGGPNKLSDEQAEKTLRWLQHGGIANFCQGEERIHRFSCEISSCIDKLIGESIIEAPVLWSSDLFMRDRRLLDMANNNRATGRDREAAAMPLWDDASSIMSFDSETRRFGSSSSTRPGSSMMMRGGDLRATLGGLNSSSGVQSYDAGGRYSFSRASTSFSETFDAQDYLSGSLLSPIPAIDTSATLWSPFQPPSFPPASSAASRAQSPAASTAYFPPFSQGSYLSRHAHSPFARHGGATEGTQTPSHVSSSRPGTSASSLDTVFQQKISDEKTKFLNELRQTLTSLLLSDLGNLVFARGSETDAWFGTLGQECIDRRDALEKRQRQEAAAEKKRRSNRNSLKHMAADNSETKKGDAGDTRLAGAGSGGSGGGGSGSVGSGGDLSPSAGSWRSQTPDAVATGANSSHSYGNDGSATASDHTATAMTAATAARLERSPLKTSTKAPSAATDKKPKPTGMGDFPFTKAYQRLLRMFCVHPNPHAKLTALFELENLIAASLSSRSTRRRLAMLTRSGSSPVISHASANFQTTASASATAAADDTSPGLSASTSVPATGRVRPLEEAIDNAKGRRSSTMASSTVPPASAMPRRGSVGGVGYNAESPRHGSGGSTSMTKDAVATILQSLFCDPAIRPKTLFRDLQFIASFVPADILDRSERGKSFWAAGLAALVLKNDVCTTMIEVADEIVGVYTQTRKPAAAHAVSSTSLPDTPGASPFSPLSLAGTYSLADAARMLTITAKEGDPTSQRELAIFYLSNPELVERTTLPLSKPREVFKKTVMEKYGGGNLSSGGGGASGAGGGGPGGKAGVYDVRNDPALMCVAYHWMEAAEQGGDKLARSFLGQNEMMKASK